MTRKLFALLLALVMLAGCGIASIASAEEDEGLYVLMTIPYEMFYEAETTAGRYDSVSSATRVKTRMMTFAGGSFHFMPDGREITGVIFPVYVENEAMLAMYGSTEVTDDTSITITVNVNGRDISTTYTGKDALFESFPFSYYRLSETPAVFKALGWDSSFGPVQGRVIEVEGSVSVVSDPYAELCLKVDGVDEVLSALDVNAVVLEADDGTRTGLKHLENIWMKTLFGMNSGAEAYEMLRGKNLARVDIYTLDAVYVVSAGDGVRIE